MNTLGQFLREYAREHHERIAYEIKRGFRTATLSFADVYSLSLQTATFLKQCTLQKGDTVAIWSPNMPEYAILYFGCWLLGVVAVPIDVRTTEEILQLFVTTANCKLGFKSTFVPGSFPNTVAHTYNLEDLRELVQELPQLEDLPEVLPDDLAEIAFTSGTTGTPKGVLLTHHNFLSSVAAFCQAFPLKKAYRTLSLLPLSHAFEQVVDLLALFRTGITVVYLERVNPVTILRALRDQTITCVVIVPELLQLLLSGVEREIEKRGKQRTWLRLQSIAPFLPTSVRRLLFRQIRQRLGKQLQFFGCGSAPLNTKLAQKWEHMGIAIYEGYGASETTAIVTLNTPSAKRLGSVGKALPGVQIHIDPDSHEIKAKGPNVSAGYFQDTKKTQEAFSDGWYRTGDIGAFDKEGYVYITGRVAFRMVLPGGAKVYPEDIEQKLDAHPLVNASCVVGVKREGGERVHAVVITKEPQKLDEIIRQVNRELSSHEQIAEWSVWEQDDFPRTPMLKIDRGKVAAAVAGREGQREKVVEETAEQEDKLLSLLAQVAEIPVAKIKETDELGTGLGLDSLEIVELLSLAEQEFGVEISETEITPATTVAQLRELLKHARAVPQEIPLNTFNFSPFITKMRVLFQNLFEFPLHTLAVPLHITGQENLNEVKLPAVFYFNHIGIMDGACVLRALPAPIRQKLAIAVNRDLWKEWRKSFVELLSGGYPFGTREDIKASLDLTGALLDRGFSILIAPEGVFSPDGTLQPFKPGTGFIAVQMDVPVVPIKIDPSYREIFPPMGGALRENLPKKRKKIWVKIGKPMTFSKQTSIEQATQEMHQVMEAL